MKQTDVEENFEAGHAETKYEFEDWNLTIPDVGEEKPSIEERRERLARLFVKHMVFECKPDSPRGYSAIYNPKEDSIAWSEMRQSDVVVIYSLPQIGEGVVASFLADEYDEFDRPRKTWVHIDLSKLIEPILEHHEYYYPVKLPKK